MKQPISPNTVALPGPFEHVMLHTRGIRLHAVVAGDPRDPLVLLIHGTFGAWLDFRHVIEPLAQEGFHVAAVDMRGYGMSDKPPSRPGDDTLLAVGDIDGMITALGHERAHLVGHDTGGALSWVYSAAYPHRVDSLVAVSAAHPYDLRSYMRRRPWQLIYMTTRVAIGCLPSWFLRWFAGAIPQVWRSELTINTQPGFHRSDAFTETLALRVQAASIHNALRGIIHNSRMLTPKLISLPNKANANAPTLAPVLLIHPPQDVWTRIDELSSARTRGPLARTSIPGAKNVPHVENPQGFVEALTNFLS
ncbi:alpha/beta fold hydrolase [Corynebacterium sp. CCUG 70398]|uniref:alpha/beta fold hydrolase n=1 Tax=Corynebacterium sp. CCUG 70398 TaxID=2823891 RepID=UPI00210A0027|nr:alpha/beta hydrolase [Corynebacterium sp. CCUG 70398]MCQ4622605.1 alpha/beta hydrolase [Corynebacterium sp. CCUG 70398]